MEQNLVVCISFFSHDCCTNLTQAHTMSPTGTDEGEGLWYSIVYIFFIYDKS